MSTPPVPTIAPYVNPAGFPSTGLPNEGYRVWLALVIMIISSGFFVAARIANRCMTRQMGADDYAIIAALASCLVQTTMWAIAVRTGYGADYLKLTEAQRQEFNKWWFFGNVFYPITIMLFKTSILLLNKRIFVHQSFQRASWVMLVINGCWGVGNFLGILLECLPIPIMWGAIPNTEGVCFNLHGLWISLVTWDVATDVIILSMPVPMLWSLNLKMKDKIMLTCLFTLGAIVVVFSIMSCSAVASSLKKSSQANKYTFALANLFQVLESNMGIIGACLPPLKGPIKHYMPWLFGSPGPSASYYYTNDGFPDQYALRNVGSKQKQGKSASWHTSSISGPDASKGHQRRSDELGMIAESTEDAKSDMEGLRDKSPTQRLGGIRKDVAVSVDRR